MLPGSSRTLSLSRGGGPWGRTPHAFALCISSTRGGRGNGRGRQTQTYPIQGQRRLGTETAAQGGEQQQPATGMSPTEGGGPGGSSAPSSPPPPQPQPADLKSACRSLDALLLAAAAEASAQAAAAAAAGAPSPSSSSPPSPPSSSSSTPPSSEAQATTLATSYKASGVLSSYGSLAYAVPKRIYTIEELKLNGIKAENLLSPKDTSLTQIRNLGQVGDRSQREGGDCTLDRG